VEHNVTSQASEISIQAKVIRANGDVEDLGTISYWNKSRWKRIKHRIRHGRTGHATQG
jgi:uncharacterized membrane protein